MTYYAALIGCGKIGSLFADDPLMKDDIFSHAAAYTSCPETELVALVDTDSAALAKCGERWNVDARFSTVAELMSGAKPQIVSIATPTPSHYSILVQLLSGDKARSLFSARSRWRRRCSKRSAQFISRRKRASCS